MPVKIISGNWDSVADLRKRIERNTPKVSEKLSLMAAKEYVKEVRRMIITQDQPVGRKWIISVNWIHRKKELNPENANKVWIASGKFIDAITVKKIAPGVYAGGAFNADRYPGSDLSVADIARFGEFGDMEEAPKPLFGPARLTTVKLMAPKVYKEIKDSIASDSYK